MGGHEHRGRSHGKVMTSPARYRATQVESRIPHLDLTDPEPVQARRATRQLLDGIPLDRTDEDGLIGAVSEVVTNAHLHGKPPVRVLGWIQDGLVVITVTDCGDGPSDPEAGVRPAPRDPGDGGFGLWLAHQMCDDVVMGCHDHGFTVRLVARLPRS